VSDYDAEVSVRAFKSAMPELLQRAHEGEFILIRRAGRPECTLGPVLTEGDDDDDE
jgi:antitoxin (DNA-binding transcriptional repressor) of toxin-antitoxin stability system